VASYSLLIKRSATKEFVDLPRWERKRVMTRIRGLATNPRPRGCEKLSGEEKHRIRQGNLRIRYEVHDADSTVTIVKVGHRRDVYR
jgi:mRNA interferase RelE/StbE